MTGDVRLRPGDRTDEAGIRALLGSVFTDHPRRDASVLRWQYWDNPYGEAIVRVAESAGQIVGTHTRWPVPVLIAGRSELGAISVDAAVAPAFRRRGLHGRNRTVSNVEACRMGIVVGFSFRGPDSMLPSEDAPAAGRMLHYALPRDAEWLAGRLRIPGSAARWIVRRATRARSGPHAYEAEGAPDDVGHLWRAVADRVPFGIVKDESWWRWRYEGHPYRPYRYFAVREGGTLTGAAVTRERQVAGAVFAYVLDLLATGVSHASALLREIAGSYDGAAAISLRARPRTMSAALAKGSGMHRIPSRLEPTPLALHVRDMCENRPELLRHPWAVGWGESDHL